MSPQKYFLGIDVSTTASKALLIDESGKTIGLGTSPHTLQTPKPLWSEQSPTEWWEATTKSIRSVLDQVPGAAAQIAAIGLTGQMHGLVLLDGEGRVLRPAILWNDQRTQAECDEIHRRVGRERFIAITGNVALPGFTAPKILWVRNHEPEIYAQARHILLPKDYIRYCLTADFAMDKADGSGTVLFDLKERGWSTELFSTLDLDSKLFPPVFEGPQISGRVSAEAAAATGLLAGTPVVAGGGDQAAQAVGVGAVEPGIVAVTLGTSGVIFASTAKPLIEPQGRLHAFCHAVPNTWHLMGVMLSAAGSLQWFRDALAPGIPFDTLLEEADGLPPGSAGLQFLPYLSGERTPYPDPLARGAFVGLTLRHGRGHLTRAVLEGVSFGLKDCFGLIQHTGLGAISQVRASGGGMKGALWRQILANVLNVELVRVSANEGAAFGAALLAGVSQGAWSHVAEACRATITITDVTKPRADWVQSYEELYAIYQELYPALSPTFHRMTG